jgi:hypothetical protein
MSAHVPELEMLGNPECGVCEGFLFWPVTLLADDGERRAWADCPMCVPAAPPTLVDHLRQVLNEPDPTPLVTDAQVENVRWWLGTLGALALAGAILLIKWLLS